MDKYSHLSTGEILAAMDREKQVFITRPQFVLALVSWAVSIIAVPAAALFPKALVWIAAGVFALTVAVAAVTGIFTGKFPYKLEKPRDALDWANTFVYYLSIVVFAFAFFISVTSGGVPRETASGYAIMNGKTVLHELTRESWRFYSAARGAMTSILTLFNCMQLGYVRKNMRY